MTTKGEVTKTATATTALVEKALRRRISQHTVSRARHSSAVRMVETTVMAISAWLGKEATDGRNSEAGRPRLMGPKL